MIRLSGRARTRLESGARGGIRTHDPRFRRPMLYPAELLPHTYFARYNEQNLNILITLNGAYSQVQRLRLIYQLN